MDYSNRVNSKKGSGGIAGREETNVHTQKRIRELLATQVLNLDNDPYVARNHLGLLECRLCLTTHISESSYISHLGGRKHQVNLERRKALDERSQPRTAAHPSINSVPKRTWTKIGRPEVTVTKVRDPETLQVGVLITVNCPKTTVDEPFFRLMSIYELNTRNQELAKKYMHADEGEEIDELASQYLVISAEPYENVCVVVPNMEIDRDTGHWSYWDKDVGVFYIQVMFGKKTEKR